MAKDKEGFLLYKDLIHTIEHLPPELAGNLFKIILEYVNDRKPEPQDLTLKIVFEPIKQQLKRDLRKYEDTVEERKIKAAMGNLKRWNKDIYDRVVNKEVSLQEALFIADERKTNTPVNGTTPPVSLRVPTCPTRNGRDKKIADTENESGSGSESVKENIDSRKLKFASTLDPFLEKYGKEMLNAFYRYWTEPNKSNSKFRQELERTWDLSRRLETWAGNDKNFKQTEPLTKTRKPLV